MEETGGNWPFTNSSRTIGRIRHTGGKRRDAPQANSSTRLPSAAIAASLPVTISRGFWPPAEASDSLRDQDFDDENNITGRPRAKTVTRLYFLDIQGAAYVWKQHFKLYFDAFFSVFYFYLSENCIQNYFILIKKIKFFYIIKNYQELYNVENNV